MSEIAQGLRILECDPPALSTAAHIAIDAPMDYLRNTGSLFRRTWQWLLAKRQAQLNSKRLRICEQVSLGEKRFVAIVQVDRQQFLLGGSANSVSLLGQLEAERSFSEVLQQSQGSNDC